MHGRVPCLSRSTALRVRIRKIRPSPAGDRVGKDLQCVQENPPGNGRACLAETTGEGKRWEIGCRGTAKCALEVLFGVLTLLEEGLVVSVTGQFAGV